MRRSALPFVLTVAAAVAAVAGARPAAADRLKDLVSFEGVRSNELVGTGLVFGLAGTGDDSGALLARQQLANMIEALGGRISAADIKAKNVAAVAVTARLPPFARKGQQIDITVSSMLSAKSLAGGTLVLTELKDGEGRTWALAQGSLAVGGFLAEAGAGTERKNHVTVGHVPGGATVEGNAPTRMPEREVVLLLRQPDFTTASRIATAIEGELGAGAAFARDAGAVVVPVTAEWRGKVASLIARLEALDATPDQRAKIVIDERTGAVVMGGDVRLSQAAIAYGGLQVSIREEPAVSQPAPASKGKTKEVPRSEVKVEEASGELHVLPAAASVADVAAALNALGAKPRDLIAVLQALARAGALRAELEVM